MLCSTLVTVCALNIYRLIQGLGLITRAIRKRPCINIIITYFARADNMLLPFARMQITCYCPRKMLLPWGKITRRKLCFYYTCKSGVISIKYVIIYNYYTSLSVIWCGLGQYCFSVLHTTWYRTKWSAVIVLLHLTFPVFLCTWIIF